MISGPSFIPPVTRPLPVAMACQGACPLRGAEGALDMPWPRAHADLALLTGKEKRASVSFFFPGEEGIFISEQEP